MTQIELQYDLVRKLQDADADAVANVHGYFGITRVRIAPSLDKVSVGYDAARLSRNDVENALLRYGVPIKRHG